MDGATIYTWTTGGASYAEGSFISPFYEAPPTPTVVSPLPALSQHTQTFGMEYYQTVGTKYYYKSGSHSGTGTSITYDYETKTWNDEGSQVPYHLNTTSTFASTTSLVNPAEIHGFGSQQNHNGTRYFSVSNPYYEAPSLNWWEDGYGALPVITGTGALNGQSFSFYSENSTHIEFIISGTESNPSTIKFTKADGSWIDGTSGDWPSQVNYDSTNVILRTNTWSNEFVNPNTSSPYTA